MSDIQYKTTFTPEEILVKKNAYLESKQALISSLHEVAETIEKSEETPITGENRKMLMNKFSTMNNELLNKFDKASFEYFEASLKQ